MNPAIALALLFHAAPSTAPASDPWFGRDKALHFGVSAGLGAAGYGGGALACDEPWVPLATGTGLALSAGVAKELLDLAGMGSPSWRDLTWDVLGTATGVLSAWAIDRLVFRRSDSPELGLAPARPLRRVGLVAVPRRFWAHPAP